MKAKRATVIGAYMAFVAVLASAGVQGAAGGDGAGADAAKKGSAAPGTARAAGAVNTIPKSVFAIDPNGRNPFNPKASSPAQRSAVADVPVPVVSPEETIQFKGVTGTGTNRVALISNVPMRAGEKTSIRGSDGVVREWELVEILNDEVVLKLGAETYRKKIADRFLQFDLEPKGAN